MRLAKAVFIVFLMLYNIAGVIHGSVLALYTGNFSVSWMAAVAGNASLLFFFFIYLMGLQPARTSARLPGLLFITSLCVLVIIIDSYINGAEVEPWIYGVVVAGVGSFLYVFWYSTLEREEIDLLKVGEPMPDIRFESYYGKQLKASDFLGRPALFVFYRGNWCTLCLAQISEIGERCMDIIDRGVSMVFISPQPKGEAQKLAVTNHPLMYFMVDFTGRAAKQLGIYHERGLPMGLEVAGYDSDTVYPTVIITDRNGIIVYVDQTTNFRVRPTVNQLIQAMDDAGITEEAAESLLPLYGLASD